MILKMKLRVSLYPDKLFVSFRPFVNKPYLLDEIESCEALTYRPIMDFGGWGVRYSLKYRHWAYNVSGNRGIVLKFTNGKKLLIGSQQADELANAITSQKG